MLTATPDIFPTGGRVHKLRDDPPPALRPRLAKFATAKPRLDRESDMRVVLAALATPGTRAEVSKRTGFAKPRAVEALHTLRERGLVEWSRAGQYGAWRAL